MVKKDDGVVTDSLAGQFARDVPIGSVTIQQLENIFKSTVRFTSETKQCYLRLNPHHTGYSFINIKGTKYAAHRVVKTVEAGRNSPELVVDHLCRNKSCVRPSHLEFVTTSVNIQRGTAWHHFKRLGDKTHCKHGHTLKDALLSKRPSGTIHRGCRTCHMLLERKRRERVRDAEIRSR